MNQEYRIRQFLNRFLFFAYIITLTYLVLFKGPVIYKIVSPLDYMLYELNQGQQGTWGYNLVPFRTVRAYFDKQQFHVPGSGISNVAGNIILMMPFGFLFPLVFRKKAGFLNVVLATFMLSLGFEAIQFMADIGFSDIDDVILNVTGGVLGFWFYYYLYR